VISALVRQALRPETAVAVMRNGVPLLPQWPNAKPVTLEWVNRMRDGLL